MPDLCLYAQVHQPYRLRRFRLFDVGTGAGWFDDELNQRILERVAAKCYLPATRLLTQLVRASQGDFRMTLSLSCTVLEQLERWAPRALEAFQELVATGSVEILGETSHHSLAGLADRNEFQAQVTRHRGVIERLFGVRPAVFRNTELIYWDGLASDIAALGFKGVLIEGADHILDWRSANYVYAAADEPMLRLIPRNYGLSDDVGFRFSNRVWEAWPLGADTYTRWLGASGGDSVHLFLDFETFGEHHWAESGIFDFLGRLPVECKRNGVRFVTPSELAVRTPIAPLQVGRPTSWADTERDVTAWLGNQLQQAAHARLYALREDVLGSGDEGLLDFWRRLTTSDHVYYMCTKWFADGDVHKYFSPFESPYDGFIAFMNVLADLELVLERLQPLQRAS